VARAEMAAAPVPNNDIPQAEAYMRRLFLFLKRVYSFQFDAAAAARQEVNWWVVHRRLFAQEKNQEMVAALAGAMSAFLGKPAEVFMEAAAQRAQGILYSDQWVRSGMDGSSPLLHFEEEALCSGYSRLRELLLAEQGAP
jgi:hypothetical protein